MFQQFGVLVLMIVALLSTGGSLVAGNKNNKAPSQSNKNQATNKARSDVQKAQSGVVAAAGQIGAAKAKIEHGRDQVVDSRAAAVKQADRAPSLEASRRLWDEARAALATASEPVLDKLELDPQYKTAVAERDRLRAASLKAPAGKSEQSRLQSEWAQAAAGVHQMEKQALLADPSTKAAMDTVAAEEADLRLMVDKKEQEIKNDPQLSAATQEIKQAKMALASAQAQYAAELRQLAQAQRNLAIRAAQSKNNNNNKYNNRRRR